MCNIHKSHYNQSVNEHNLDTGTIRTYPKRAKTFPFWVTVTNSLSFPWFCCVSPKFPDWKIGNSFSRFSLISRVAGNPAKARCKACSARPRLNVIVAMDTLYMGGNDASVNWHRCWECDIHRSNFQISPVADRVCVCGRPPPNPWTCPATENLCKVCVTGTDPPPPWNVDDVTRAMSKGGGGALWMSKRGCLAIFRRVDDVTQAMSKGGGVLVNVLFTPPPFQEILYPRLISYRDYAWVGQIGRFHLHTCSITVLAWQKMLISVSSHKIFL